MIHKELENRSHTHLRFGSMTAAPLRGRSGIQQERGCTGSIGLGSSSPDLVSLGEGAQNLRNV